LGIDNRLFLPEVFTWRGFVLLTKARRSIGNPNSFFSMLDRSLIGTLSFFPHCGRPLIPAVQDFFFSLSKGPLVRDFFFQFRHLWAFPGVASCGLPFPFFFISLKTPKVRKFFPNQPLLNAFPFRFFFYRSPFFSPPPCVGEVLTPDLFVSSFSFSLSLSWCFAFPFSWPPSRRALNT